MGLLRNNPVFGHTPWQTNPNRYPVDLSPVFKRSACTSYQEHGRKHSETSHDTAKSRCVDSSCCNACTSFNECRCLTAMAEVLIMQPFEQSIIIAAQLKACFYLWIAG